MYGTVRPGRARQRINSISQMSKLDGRELSEVLRLRSDSLRCDWPGPGPCSTLIGKSENTVPVVRTEECSSCSCAPPNRNNQHSSLLQQRNTTGWFLHLIMGCIVYYYYVVNTGRGSLLGFILTQFTSAEISVIQSELLQKPPPKPSQP